MPALPRTESTILPPPAGGSGDLPSGVVIGRPLAWLRAEGLAVAAAAVAMFASTGRPWWLLAALFLVPDLFAVGYVVNRRVGAFTYNLAHTLPLPLALLCYGVAAHNTALVVAGTIGLTHVGADRVLKYGVKYDHDPSVTHLGRHGRH